MSDKKSKLIRAVKEASCLQEGLGYFEELIRVLGFDYYMFSLLGTQDSPATFKVNYYQTSFPEGWLELYLGRKYFYIDPIAKRVMSNEMPFFWSEYLAGASLDEETVAMMTHAQMFGLCDGAAFSYLKNKGQLYTLSLSRGQFFEVYDEKLLAETYLVGAYLTNLHQKDSLGTTSYQELSSREREVISMAAMGKTDAEIAQLAGISTNTVRYHWKNIFDKTDSYSRVFAIIRALNLGYIDPHIFEIPTESGSYESYKKYVR